VQRRGCLFAELTGELLFSNGRQLVVYERLNCDAGTVRIVGYSSVSSCKASGSCAFSRELNGY
jgi:hypothetical protein